MRTNRHRFMVRLRRAAALAAVLGMLPATLISGTASAAINPLPIPNPKENSYGLEATKKQAPPDQPPVITSPGGGTAPNQTVTVAGTCKDDLLVQVYDNGVLVGAVQCKNGSFSVQISLFAGQNELTAIQFDDLGQASPISNSVIITFNNASFTSFGALITLTSAYGRRSANPNTKLTWPLQLSGGTGPYAFSIDWGDGSAPELKSVAFAGLINIEHTYKQAGIYNVTVKVTDVNGVSAFIQLVAVANGKPVAGSTSDTNDNKTVVVTKVLWLPALICALLMPLTFWLGRRSELVSLHKKLEHDMAAYKDM